MEKKEPKIVYANIKIPIEIDENGAIEPLKEYIQINFEHCLSLPPKQENTINYSFLRNNLKELLDNPATTDPSVDPPGPSETENPPQKKEEEPFHITISKDEIKLTKKPKLNTSFKQYHKYNHRHTAKMYHDITYHEKVVDSQDD
jgi:hypothetical protein